MLVIHPRNGWQLDPTCEKLNQHLHKVTMTEPSRQGKVGNAAASMQGRSSLNIHMENCEKRRLLHRPRIVSMNDCSFQLNRTEIYQQWKTCLIQVVQKCLLTCPCVQMAPLSPSTTTATATATNVFNKCINQARPKSLNDVDRKRFASVRSLIAMHPNP